MAGDYHALFRVVGDASTDNFGSDALGQPRTSGKLRPKRSRAVGRRCECRTLGCNSFEVVRVSGQRIDKETGMPDELDPAALEIISFPHPTLRYEAKLVRRVDRRLRDVAARMFELMYENRGVGLAATQVDLPIRLFVMNPSGQQGEGFESVLINPVVTKPRGNEEAEEGCLSLPNVHGNVVRAKTIHLHAYNLEGQEIDQELSGFEARVVQHETDHLDGTLFIDRLKEGAIGEISGELDALNTDFRSRQRTEAIPDDEQLLARLVKWEAAYC